ERQVVPVRGELAAGESGRHLAARHVGSVAARAVLLIQRFTALCLRFGVHAIPLGFLLCGDDHPGCDERYDCDCECGLHTSSTPCGAKSFRQRPSILSARAAETSQQAWLERARGETPGCKKEGPRGVRAGPIVDQQIVNRKSITV